MDNEKTIIYFHTSTDTDNDGLNDETDAQKMTDAIQQTKKRIDKLVRSILESNLGFDSSIIKKSIILTTKCFTSFGSEQIFNVIKDNLSAAIVALSSKILENPSPFSEEERKALISNYENWGKLGWTAPIIAPDVLLQTSPDADARNAHNCFMSLFSKKSEIEKLFDVIKGYFPKNKDFESAVFCFLNRQYKACALILFSLIDSICIRAQNRTEKLKTGMGAIKKLVKQSKNHDENLFQMLQGINLFSCLTVLFQDTGNFTKKFPIINRNYIMHGMNTSHVRKRDCIQLFLVLANLSFFLFGKNNKPPKFKTVEPSHIKMQPPTT